MPRAGPETAARERGDLRRGGEPLPRSAAAPGIGWPNRSVCLG